MATEKYLLGSISTLLDTGLNSLANNALAIGSAYDNTIGQTGDGHTLCDVELVVTFAVAPSVGAVAVWFLGSADGTNYEDGDASTTPARGPDLYFPVRAVTSGQRINIRTSMPWGLWKPLLKNEATGQAFSASGNTLKIRPVTRSIA